MALRRQRFLSVLMILWKIEHIGERRAAPFRGLEYSIHLLDPLGRQASADVVVDPFHQVFGLGQDAALSDGLCLNDADHRISVTGRRKLLLGVVAPFLPGPSAALW